MTTDTTLAAVRAAVQPLRDAPFAYDELLERIGDARVVLIGEASHGTHEFYHIRAELTKRLIAERGFTIVGVEADWPDAYRVNCFVRGAGADRTPEAALDDFTRFPTWMWRNTVVRDFAAWMRQHNATLAQGIASAGFYGLDLYSLYTSIQEVVAYLDRTDPEAARRARERYGCLEDFGRDPQRYGYAASFGRETCEDEVVAQMVEVQRRAAERARQNSHIEDDDHFYAEQNARLVKNAEEYYRAMFRGREESWNIRDRHMAETLDELLAHHDRPDRPAKAVVWAHNSHLGDARATEMHRYGELNVGQLVRERYGPEAFLIGFSTYHGTVTAANDWDEPPQHKQVRAGLSESYEALFHAVNSPRFWLDLRDPSVAKALRTERLERAIGVVYRPQTERASHYFYARLADQFDAVIHVDETRALEPLEQVANREFERSVPETYPFGQ